MNDSKVLLYKKSALNWLEAMPLGNGSIGAMVYGKTNNEIVSMNADTLWTGYPRESAIKDGAHEAFLEARELALNGEYYKSKLVLEEKVLSNCSQAYMPLCDIHISYLSTGLQKKYSRTLNLETGVNTVTYTRGTVEYKRESFVAFDENAYIDHISSLNGNNINLTVSLTTKLKGTFFTENDTLILDGIAPSDSPANQGTYAKMEGPLYPDEKELQGISFRCAVKIISDGEVIVGSDFISVNNGSYATIIFCTENSFNGFDKHPALEGKEYKNACISHLNEVSAISYDDLYGSHTQTFSSYFNRVCLDLGSDNMDDVPTDKRLINHSKGIKDMGLYTLIFNFGRYLIISGSKEGTQPTTLQGIWNDKLSPPWSSNYTVNINTEMNYWPVLMCNLAEFNLPLVEFIKELSVRGEVPAQKIFNARGFCSFHNVDIWRFCDPAAGDAQWGYWQMAGGWFCQHLYNHYLYTNDKAYLKETAYPIMKKACEFMLDLLVEDKDGYLILAPSTSPENQFYYKGKETSVSETTTMTMGIVRELFTNTIAALEVLKIQKKFKMELEEKLEKLLPFKIGSRGELLEWYKEERECEPHHRHKSHLYALHPANLITPDETPDLAEACKKSLELRGDNGTGWSLGWKINMWARLWDGNHALKLVDIQLSPVPAKKNVRHGGGTYPNLFDAHPPFQIDGNYGCASGIAEMLLQSRKGKIFLLPALPDLWQNGKITGLKAIGNITVDIEWENGELKNYKLTGRTKGIEIYCKGVKIQ